jgi:hypothetical protein
MKELVPGNKTSEKKSLDIVQIGSIVTMLAGFVEMYGQFTGDPRAGAFLAAVGLIAKTVSQIFYGKGRVELKKNQTP